MSEENKELPEGWCWAELDDLGRWIGGGTPSKATSQFWTSGDIPWVSPKDMKTFRIIDTEDHLSTIALEEANLKLCPVGTILVVVRSGILLRTLPVAVSQVPVTINQDMKGLCPRYNISSDYIAYYLIASTHDILSRCSKDGTTVTSLESGALRSYPIPIAPLAEQRLIVAAIEQQFSRLDAAIESLNHARKKLKRERAAILKAAFEGRLTEQWRAEHPASETASQQLEHILAERRAKWEADQLAKMQAKGVTPKDEKWKEAYREPEMPDTTGLLELPEGWIWINMSNLVINGPQNGLYLPKSAYGKGIPILRIDDFQNGYSRSSSELRLVDAKDEDIAIYGLCLDDLIINRVNSPSHLGKCLVISNRNLPALFESNMMRLHLSEIVEAKFVMLYLQSDLGRSYLTSNAKWAVNQASINQDDVCNTFIPLPPLIEQRYITKEVESLLSVIQELEVEVEANLKRAARLRQAILSEAFAGRLVPQDPQDEPASVLLERIREEREERKKGKGERGNGDGNRTGHGRFVEVSSEPVRMDVEDVEQGALW